MSSVMDARGGAKILEKSAGVHRLTSVTILDVSGDDTRSWLNGQLTNDVRNTRAGDAVYALAVTVKGKILADVWAYDRGADRFWLAVPKVAVPALLESFEQQIIMEDVEVVEDESLSVVTIAGPDASEIVAAVDASVYATERLGPSQDVILRSDDEESVSALVSAAEAKGGGAVDDAAWDLARLRRSTPRFAADFDGRNYPQEAGLKDRAVSFQKGCYLGQEVVCMLESRGKLSKRLVALSMAGAEPAAAESEITSDDGEGIGRVTSSVPDGDTTLALGYVKTAFAEVGAKLTVAGRSAEVTAIVGAP